MTLKSHGRKSISATLKPRSLMDEPETLAGVWTAQVITLLPQAFPGLLGESLTGKALKDGLWQLQTVNLREHGLGKHRNVDDTPAGGGAGMVLRADVMESAIAEARPRARGHHPLVYLSPRGRRFDQQMARDWARGDGVTLICGRFEGLDERVIEHFGIQEVSLGDFVMTGGEPAALAMLDATVRLLPGVLGNAASTEEESFSEGLLEHPQYTRPPEWQGREIPEVIMSGHHGEIAKWRRRMAEGITRARRPDLWAATREALLDDAVRQVRDAESLATFLDAEAPELQGLAEALRNRGTEAPLPADPYRALAQLVRQSRG
ncbi:tRNA (guanosine(37)-N1)-methyltransferase TrmD [Ferrimonas balearica]|nr:tRNA (guanosine(37)-N1)-methyltransferase TrmD [Ferrimonas balearica]